MKFFKMVLIVIVFLIAITFATKNQETISLRYYFFDGSLTMPLFLLIFLALLTGILLAGCAGVFAGFKLKYEIRRHKKMIFELEKELSSLRNLPITEPEDPEEHREE